MKKSASQPGATPGSAMTPFQFSRLYAKGWVAGRGCDFDVTDGDFDTATATQNPGKTAVERARWLKGFKEGLQGKGD